MSEITAIVNVFRRETYLDEQILAIRNQSLPPKSIFIFNNGNKKVDISKYETDPLIKIINCSYNSGVWTRFLISQFADTEYVCIFDDDTIPGVNWFLNCMNCMKNKEALYGTIGVVFKDSDETYCHLKRYGWDGNSNEPKPVDIVGHSWFFKKKWISILLREPPKVNEYFSVGEDMCFSHMLQKYANIPTYVPPHPANDLTMFGSIPKSAWKYGCDGNSGSNVNCNFNKVYSDICKDGFITLVKRQRANSVSDLNSFINKIKNNVTKFAIIRPSDGEYRVLQNSTLTNIDNWTFKANGKLNQDLFDAVKLASKKSCYIGIPCECDNINIARWYINTFKLHPVYTTFANIFCNKNWKTWVDFLVKEKIGFNFIGPNNFPHESDFVVKKYINIPIYLVNDWDTKGDDYLNSTIAEIKKHKNELFLFSAGPIAKILISKLWDEHPENIYLDVGSIFDGFIKGSTNRHYSDEKHPLSRRECNYSVNLIVI